MKKFWLALAVTLVLASSAQAQWLDAPQTYNDACAAEMQQFCPNAIPFHMARCLMRFQRFVSPGCLFALDEYNFNNQRWYPEARTRWIREFDANRNLR